jgi:hypothetical protein
VCCWSCKFWNDLEACTGNCCGGCCGGAISRSLIRRDALLGSGGRGAALLARDMTGLGCDSRVASPWKMAPWGQFNESVLAQYLRSKQNQGHV